MTSYKLVQSYEARNFLSHWSYTFGWAAILSSILLPALGIYLAAVSISFGLKRRGSFHAFPFVSLIVSLSLLFAHMYLWALVIDAI